MSHLGLEQLLYKGFVILDKYYQVLKNVTMSVKQSIHAINMFDIDYLMSFSTAIPYIDNNLKKIYISGTLLNESTSRYYDDNNDSFEMLFQQYASSAVKNIYHLAIF